MLSFACSCIRALTPLLFRGWSSQSEGRLLDHGSARIENLAGHRRGARKLNRQDAQKNVHPYLFSLTSWKGFWLSGNRWIDAASWATMESARVSRFQTRLRNLKGALLPTAHPFFVFVPTSGPMICPCAEEHQDENENHSHLSFRRTRAHPSEKETDLRQESLSPWQYQHAFRPGAAFVARQSIPRRIP